VQNSPQKIAVIGAGVAGIVAAHILSRRFAVTLIESADYVGGHTNTITIQRGPDEGTPVDTGFIVLNDQTYPNFQKFLSQLKVAIRKSEMTFSFYNRDTGLAYSSQFPNGLFAQRLNLFRPSFLGMIRDYFRFNKNALRDLEAGRLQGQTLGQYLWANRYSETFIKQFLIPCTAAIWSTPPQEALDFPIETFVTFYNNHGMLAYTTMPQWYTVVGGSHTYVKAFLERFPGQLLINAPVASVSRHHHGVTVRLKDRRAFEFDKVVIAAHADQALAMLADPSPDEQRWLGAWRYHRNDTILHTDTSILSPNRRAWASWNYITDRRTNDHNPVTVAYYMNRLQGLKTANHYFVSLNHPAPIPDEHIIKRLNYSHPNYTFASLASQPYLPTLNGPRHTYFCGSYFGYGFHEDAVKSAVAVGRAFGLDLDSVDSKTSAPVVAGAMKVFMLER
jgi:predicted NAD/FAD-binding protein